MNALFLLLIALALLTIQCLIGGTRFVYSFPSYLLLGGVGVLSLLAFKRPLSRPSTPAFLSALLLAGYVLIRASCSPYPYFARSDLYMALACVVVYLFTTVLFTDTRYRLALVWVLLSLCVLEVYVGFRQFSELNGYMLFGINRNSTLWRASGTFISGNHFAGFLEAMAMFGLAIACWSRQPKVLRAIAALIALGCYAGVAMSGSRGGYLSSAFSILVFAALSIRVLLIARPGAALRPSLYIVATVALLFGAIGYFGYNNQTIRDRASRITQPEVRFYNWQAALDHAKVNPVFGTGSGTHIYYGRLFRRPPLQSDPIHAHNDYLEMLAEYGIVGASLALFFLAAHITSGLHGNRQIALRRLQPHLGSDTLALNMGALGAVSALLAHSVVDFNMHIPGNALTFAFIFGILSNPGRNPLPFALPTLTTAGRLLLPATSLLLIVLVIPKYPGEILGEKARRALRDGNLRESIDLGQKAIQEEQENPDIWFNLGEANRLIAKRSPVLVIKNRFSTSAEKAYRSALRCFPEDIHTLVRLGQTYDGMEQYDLAEAAYLSALRHDPNLGALYHYIADHYRNQGNKELFRKYFDLSRRFPTDQNREISEIDQMLNTHAKEMSELEAKEKH